MGPRAKVIPLPFVKAPSPPRESHDLVEVRRCRDQAEALVVRSVLDSEGISSVLRGHLVSSLHPFSVGAQAMVRVLVHEFDALRARALLTRRR
jgi:Putative prokaryotic signal transducing protein